MDEIIKFINSIEYECLLNELQLKVSLEIAQSIPSFTVLNYDIERLKRSSIEIKDLLKIISTHNQKIQLFILLKFEKYLGIKEEEEYPEGYNPDEEDEKNQNIKTLPFNRNFLILYLIEYYLLNNKPEDYLIIYRKVVYQVLKNMKKN